MTVKSKTTIFRFREPCPLPPASLADISEVQRAYNLLGSAQRPLVVVGKGAAYSHADAEVKQFVECHNLPFLPTPMGKGMLPDDHNLCVSAARSRCEGFFSKL